MNGIFIADKPPGVTSHDVINLARQATKIKKIGHTGTLDPFATGVLPLCIGKATKIAQFITAEDKDYRATMRLGQQTDTYDLMGKIIKESTNNIHFTEDEISEVFNEFRGRIKQVPPPFSAKKYKGKPLYRWARRGITIHLSEKEVEIFRIEIKEIHLPHITYDVTCSKGTYIRTLSNDIGKKLGCGAHLTDLRRLRVGKFHIDSAHTIDNMVSLVKKGLLGRELISMNQALDHFQEISLPENIEKRMLNGGQLLLRDLDKISLSTIERGDKIKIISNKGDLIAVAIALVGGEESRGNHKEKPFFRLIRVF